MTFLQYNTLFKLMERLMHLRLAHLADIIICLACVPYASAVAIDVRNANTSVEFLHPMPEYDDGDGRMRKGTVIGIIVGLLCFFILFVACNKIWTSFNAYRRTLPHPPQEQYTPADRETIRGRTKIFFLTFGQFLTFLWNGLRHPNFLATSSIPISHGERNPGRAQNQQIPIPLSNLGAAPGTTTPTLASMPSAASRSGATDGGDLGVTAGERVVVAEPSPPSAP